MAIYLTGDTHRCFYRLWDFCEQKHTTKDDYLIILGDAGINYYGFKEDREIKTFLQELPITLFCVHGNHEKRPTDLKLSALPEPWDDWARGYEKQELTDGNIQGQVYVEPEFPNIMFAVDGTMYTMAGTHKNYMVLVCGGAYSVDKYYRLRHGWNWFSNEQPDNKTKTTVRTLAETYPVDIVLSHTCPQRFIPTELFLSGIDQSTVDTSTEEFFDEIYDLLPNLKQWYFGHYHGNKKIANLTMLFDQYEKL